jgi:crotonobetainyl-CoA:carnitine CoA-transferase CaiB-like acyl-CoA transferase
LALSPSEDHLELALSGVRVIEADEEESGAVAGMVLAQHGASVLKLTTLGETSASWHGLEVWDRGKTKLALDVADPTAVQLLSQQLRDADVVIQGGGAVAKLLSDAGGAASCRLQTRC